MQATKWILVENVTDHISNKRMEESLLLDMFAITTQPCYLGANKEIHAADALL